MCHALPIPFQPALIDTSQVRLRDGSGACGVYTQVSQHIGYDGLRGFFYDYLALFCNSTVSKVVT